jgi:predicted regulator of Ras-like GTPase activity (Roadblock/LC7/MglB family)
VQLLSLAITEGSGSLEQEEIETVLKDLNNTNPQILLSMVINPDGLALSYEGEVDDIDKVGALYIELLLVCRKIMSKLKCGELEEMFIRSKSGCVVLRPIADKGVLACMSTPDVNSSKMQMFTWKAVSQLFQIM